MKSWVRYSIAVYVGLLLAGSLVTSRQASAGSNWEQPLPAVLQSIPPLPEPRPVVGNTVAQTQPAASNEVLP